MIKLNPNVSELMPTKNPHFGVTDPQKVSGSQKADFSETVKAVEKYISKVDDSQQSANTSIKDLLTGKNEDVTSVVAAMAKADMSFKLLVGVRNKLIEAYKQTMNMPL